MLKEDAHRQGDPGHHFPSQHLLPYPPIPPCPDPTTEDNRTWWFGDIFTIVRKGNFIVRRKK